VLDGWELGMLLGDGDFVSGSETLLLGLCDGWELGTLLGAGDGNWDGVSDGDLDIVLDGVSDGDFDGVLEGTLLEKRYESQRGPPMETWRGTLMKTWRETETGTGNLDGSLERASKSNAEALLLATEVGAVIATSLCS
jgi:hypothetical protein